MTFPKLFLFTPREFPPHPLVAQNPLISCSFFPAALNQPPKDKSLAVREGRAGRLVTPKIFLILIFFFIIIVFDTIIVSGNSEHLGAAVHADLLRWLPVAFLDLPKLPFSI